MIVGPCVSSVCDTLEIVKIKLALEGSELSLLEELAHDLILEFARLVNHK